MDTQDKQDKKIMSDLAKSIRRNFGRKCPDHVEECCVCNAYKALNELQRLYGVKETS
jgi:hypothetical protein